MKKAILFLLTLFLFVNVNAEGEATLKNLKINGKECKCIDYKCQIELDATSATVTFDLDDSNATVDRQSGFTKDLTSLQETIKIVVSNTLNDEKIENTYEIVITKHEKSSDTSLSALKVNNTEIKLVEEVYVYSYTAKYDEDKIIIKASCKDANAKIITNLEFDFPLEQSSGAFDFDVEAENGDRLTYRIVAQRGDRPNTYLKSLKFDKANIEFKKDTFKYETTVEYNINSLSVDAVAESEKAKVKIINEDLVVGENEIKVVVTNEKAESTYTVLVTREENMDKSLANLKSLKIRDYSKLDFNPNVLEYDLKFNEIPDKLIIDAQPVDENGVVEILGNKELIDDDKVVIKVTVNDKIVREYTLHIMELKGMTNNKKIIAIFIIILIITMIVLFILQIKEKKKRKKDVLNKVKELIKKKNSKKTKVNKEKKKEEEEIEII